MARGNWQYEKWVTLLAIGVFMALGGMALHGKEGWLNFLGSYALLFTSAFILLGVTFDIQDDYKTRKEKERDSLVKRVREETRREIESERASIED